MYVKKIGRISGAKDRLKVADAIAQCCPKKGKSTDSILSVLGAGDEARTRYLHLGKVALYQMSYTRNSHGLLYRNFSKCQALF